VDSLSPVFVVAREKEIERTKRKASFTSYELNWNLTELSKVLRPTRHDTLLSSVQFQFSSYDVNEAVRFVLEFLACVTSVLRRNFRFSEATGIGIVSSSAADSRHRCVTATEADEWTARRRQRQCDDDDPDSSCSATGVAAMAETNVDRSTAVGRVAKSPMRPPLGQLVPERCVRRVEFRLSALMRREFRSG